MWKLNWKLIGECWWWWWICWSHPEKRWQKKEGFRFSDHSKFFFPEIFECLIKQKKPDTSFFYLSKKVSLQTFPITLLMKTRDKTVWNVIVFNLILNSICPHKIWACKYQKTHSLSEVCFPIAICSFCPQLHMKQLV